MSSVMLGRYRLIAELGRGGMAEVFLAVTSAASMSFSKLVVVKKLREHLADDADFTTMLIDEARIAARLNHPNLVQTIEVGEADGNYFLTMEYLDGQPLHRLLSRARATLPLPIHLSVLADVLAGIHYAHELKDYDGSPLHIVHRDVTPHNCFITYEGQVKVVDFGIAKAVGRASETRHGVVKGKTAYMAPEQATGQHVDQRSDVFAVGVMLFEAVARQRMWKGVSETDIIRRLVRGEIPSSPKDVDPTVDDELDRICRRALEHAPSLRYQTAAELQADLDAFLKLGSGRPSQREVGGLVAELFADKRATTDKIIASQLAFLRADPRASSTSRSAPSATSNSGVAFSSTLTTGSRGGLLSEAPKSESMRSESHKSGEQPDLRTLVMVRQLVRSNRTALAPLIIAAALLAVGTMVLTILSLSKDTTSSSPPPPVVAGTNRQITVTLRASPPKTRFSIDDGPLQDNPFNGQFTADGREHVILAVAPGHAPHRESVTFKEDVSVRFTLSSVR